MKKSELAFLLQIEDEIAKSIGWTRRSNSLPGLVRKIFCVSLFLFIISYNFIKYVRHLDELFYSSLLIKS